MQLPRVFDIDRSYKACCCKDRPNTDSCLQRSLNSSRNKTQLAYIIYIFIFTLFFKFKFEERTIKVHQAMKETSHINSDQYIDIVVDIVCRVAKVSEYLRPPPSHSFQYSGFDLERLL